MKPIIGSDYLFNKLIRPIGRVDSYVTRLTLGVGALAIEPFVDYYSNKNLDEQSRSYSAVKTCAKIVIGTSTGVVARFLGQKQGAKFFEELMRKKLKDMPEIAKLQGNLQEIKTSVKEYLTSDKFDLPQELSDKIKSVFGEDGCKKLLNTQGSEGAIREAKIKLSRPGLNPAEKDEILLGVNKSLENSVPIPQEMVDTFRRNLPFSKAHGEKIVKDTVNDPQGVVTTLSKGFGDVVGVLSAALFTLAFDVPLINLSLNYIMEKLFPDYTAKHQKAAPNQKITEGK